MTVPVTTTRKTAFVIAACSTSSRTATPTVHPLMSEICVAATSLLPMGDSYSKTSFCEMPLRHAPAA